MKSICRSHHVALALLVFLWSYIAIGNAQSQQVAMQVTKNASIKGWRSGDRLFESLLAVGRLNRLPLGIVVEGDSLCRALPADDRRDVSNVFELENEVERLSPDYIVEIRDGVLMVRPKGMSPAAQGLLDLTIPRFATRPSTVQEIGISLWMHMRAVLIPQEGSAFEGGMQRNAELLPPFEMNQSDVRSILNRVVKGGGGGLWVLQKIPSDWLTHPKSDPVDLFSYSGDSDTIGALKCSPTSSSYVRDFFGKPFQNGM